VGLEATDGIRAGLRGLENVERITVKLTHSFVLTTEHKRSVFGLPVLVNLRTGEAYMPTEVLEAYPLWGKMQARDVVRMMVKGKTFSDKERHFMERFIGRLPS
jgi:hypothetical protein